MNFNRENAENLVNCCFCYYCNELYDNYPAYENHLITHHKEKAAWVGLNNAVLLSHFSTTTIFEANVVPSTQTPSFIGGSNSTFCRCANGSNAYLGFPNSKFSNATTPLHLTNSFRGEVGDNSSNSGKYLSPVSYSNKHDGSRQHSNPNRPAACPSLSGVRLVQGSSSNDVSGVGASHGDKSSVFGPFEIETPQANLLPLLMTLEKSMNEQPRSSNVAAEDHGDLDLSLHL